jgi:LPS export ABC transporter protein LptC
MPIPQRATPRRLTRAVLVVMILTAATTGVVYFVRQRLVSVVEPEPAPKTGSEAMVAERIHQAATRDGRTEWSLDAASAQYLLPEKKVLLKDLFVTFFTQDGQKVYLTALNGMVKTDSHDMEAHDDVVVYNDLYRLETERMNYAQVSRLITSDTPVKITGQTGEVLADSLAMDLKTNKLGMKGNVRGTLVSSGENGTPPRRPLRIQSEQLAADMNADTVEFSGRVRIVDDIYTITSDSLTVHFKPQPGGQNRLAGAVSARDIARMVARGRVVIRSQSLTAGADVGEYEPDTGRATLWGEKATSPNSAATRLRTAAPSSKVRPPAGAETLAGRVRVAVMPSADRR